MLSNMSIESNSTFHGGQANADDTTTHFKSNNSNTMVVCRESTQLQTNRQTNNNSKTIWTGKITPSKISLTASFEVSFECTEVPETVPKCLGKRKKLLIVGQTCVAKVDKFTKNKGHRTMHIYGINIINNEEIYTQISPQYVEKESVGVIQLQTGHIYLVPQALKNKIEVLKNKTFSADAIAIVIIKSVEKEKAPVNVAPNLCNALSYYYNNSGNGYIGQPQTYPQACPPVYPQACPPVYPQTYPQTYPPAYPQTYPPAYPQACPPAYPPVYPPVYPQACPSFTARASTHAIFQPYKAPIPQSCIPQAPPQHVLW